MIAEPLVQHNLPPGPRFALDACALSFGATRGPILLFSSQPAWENLLRSRLGNRFFTLDDPDRPPAQAWIGAAWLEPQRPLWREQLQALTHELPGGSLLSIVQSLPLSILRQPFNSAVVGIVPFELLGFRATVIRHGFRVERTFGFQTLWWSLLGRVAARIEPSRPDWSDRLQFAMRRGFAMRAPALAFAMTGLIEARAGMRPG